MTVRAAVRSQGVARVADRTAHIRRLASDFRSQKVISQNNCSPIHAMVTLLYWTLQSMLRCDTAHEGDGYRHS